MNFGLFFNPLLSFWSARFCQSRRWLRLIAGLLALLWVIPVVIPPVNANPVKTVHAQAELISETTAIQAGQPLQLALRLIAQDGWHTYWRHPGDSGLATQITWTLPAGFSASEIEWPYPERIPVGPLMNFGYHGDVILPVKIQPPASLSAGETVTLRARADWLICQEDCIPEQATLELSLPVSADPASLDRRWTALLAATRRALPVTAPWPVHFSQTPTTLSLIVNAGPAAERITALEFFPLNDGVIEHAAPQALRRQGDAWQLSVARGTLTELPSTLSGVMVVRERLEEGETSANAFSIAAAPVSAPTPPVSGGQLLQMLILAWLGGLLLNLMPCVFPVLSLKALGLAQQAHHAPGAVRAHGLAYTAGVLVCFALIAGLLMALRTAGQQIGWGFQLQSPAFVTLLAYLLFVLGLSLSGLFMLGGSLMGVGGTWAEQPGYGGSFATGALAVVVATPCTAPFMGAAVGFALIQPWWVSLSVFQALGLGLALPYLALSLWPTLLRFLPRPGPWLERTKQFLAFPLYATAAWLVWVLSQQAGPTGVAVALAGMILIAFGLWLMQTSRDAGPRGQRVARIGAGLAALLALLLAWLPNAEAPDSSPSANAATATAAGLPAEPFSAARVSELRTAGQPVLVNFTAAWCITCLVNERVALSSTRVAEALAAKNVTYLKGDWTRRDPAITAALAEFGRAGVPLYVLYRPHVAEPTVLPQLLTESLLLETLHSL